MSSSPVQGRRRRRQYVNPLSLWLPQYFLLFQSSLTRLLRYSGFPSAVHKLPLWRWRSIYLGSARPIQSQLYDGQLHGRLPHERNRIDSPAADDATNAAGTTKCCGHGYTNATTSILCLPGNPKSSVVQSTRAVRDTIKFPSHATYPNPQPGSTIGNQYLNSPDSNLPPNRTRTSCERQFNPLESGVASQGPREDLVAAGDKSGIIVRGCSSQT